MSKRARKPKYTTSVLEKAHDKKSFCCGVEALDSYLHHQASQQLKKKVSVTYVLAHENDSMVLGYYSLASTSIKLAELPSAFAKKFPRYPFLPAILLGRLAVDKRCQGRGLGGYLLFDSLKRSLEASLGTGGVVVVVDAKNQQAVDFYKQYDFDELEGHELKLFFPMNEIKKIDFPI